MKLLKWIEVNIGMRNDIQSKTTILLNFIVPLVEKTRQKVRSWHFLWQGRRRIHFRNPVKRILIHKLRANWQVVYKCLESET